MRVTWLGLGAMGRRMVARLDDGVRTYNRSPVEGFALAPTPRAAALDADVIWSMVRDDDAASEVWLHPDRGALASVRPGTVLIESSTLTPGLVSQLSAEANARGAKWLDAPVVGSTPQAEAGQLVFLVGGSAEDVEIVRPLFERMGNVLHMGLHGHGMVAKLVVNALFATQVAALAEGLAIGASHGLHGQDLLDKLGGLPVFGPAARAAGARMVAGDDTPRFPVHLVAKDLRYAVAAGGGPVIAAARAQFEALAATGLGERDLVSIGSRTKPVLQR